MLTRATFRQHAQPLNVTINGAPLVAEPKEFSTKSLGWNVNGKMSIMLNGEPVQVQVGLNLTVVKSKELPE